jgi:hypothetical protein
LERLAFLSIAERPCTSVWYFLPSACVLTILTGGGYMIQLTLSPAQYKILFDMIVLCIASTDKSAERDEMQAVQDCIQEQVADQCIESQAVS